jgi:Flp pilus assembly protein TadB
MSRLAGLAGLSAFAGWALVLAGLPWFRRRPLVDRIAPYLLGPRRPAAGPSRSGSDLSIAATWRELASPLAQATGERLARLFGVTEPLHLRLERVHSPMTTTEFRFRQLTCTGAGLGLGTLVAAIIPLPGGLAFGFIVGGPLLAFLVVEQRSVAESDRWRRHLVLELPVVAEQVGMLLGSGYSLGGALNRVAERGQGVCGRDISRVCERIRLGLSEVSALREWAALADVAALHRLVGVLSLNRQAGDLDRLISEEARSMRRDVHRELVATIERRAQQVWIPVTVATLVPGVIFLAVPFVEALRMFGRA